MRTGQTLSEAGAIIGGYRRVVSAACDRIGCEANLHPKLGIRNRSIVELERWAGGQPSLEERLRVFSNAEQTPCVLVAGYILL